MNVLWTLLLLGICARVKLTTQLQMQSFTNNNTEHFKILVAFIFWDYYNFVSSTDATLGWLIVNA